jgi:hypothetical protein
LLAKRPPTACRHAVSGTISLPSTGCFSPFPHGTGSLSVAKEYLALRDGPRRFPRDSSCPAVLRYLPKETARVSPTGLSPSVARHSRPVRLPCCFVTLRPHGPTGPTTPPCKHDGLGYIRVRSPLLAESLLISVPVGTEMVHFPTLPSRTYGFSPGYPGMTPGGFPHSEISGSKLVCSSPKLIAAYHVLHRLLAPRHSPHALSSLTIRTPDLHHAAREGDAMKSRLSHTAVWSVKTTVCRIFSCQRAPPSPGRSHEPDGCHLVPHRRVPVIAHVQAWAETGGEYRARTGDLLLAKQALSQLS